MRDDIIEACALAALNTRRDQLGNPRVADLSELMFPDEWQSVARAVLAAFKEATAEPSDETRQKINSAAFKGYDVFTMTHDEIFQELGI